MSPIEEETVSDDMEEGEGQDPENDQTDSCAESLPDGKKRAKKLKKIKTEQVPAGKCWSHVNAHGFLFCLEMFLNRTGILFLKVIASSSNLLTPLHSKFLKLKTASHKNCKKTQQTNSKQHQKAKNSAQTKKLTTNQNPI